MQVIDPAREESHYRGEMKLAIVHCFADPAVTGIVIDPLASNTKSHRDCFVYHLPRPGNGKIIGTRSR